MMGNLVKSASILGNPWRLVFLTILLLTACSPADTADTVPAGAGFLETAAVQTLTAVQTLLPTVWIETPETPERQASATLPPVDSQVASPTAVTPTFTISPTQTATVTMKPTRTATSGPTQRPTRTPTVTPTAYAPSAAISILQPGPQSRIMNPLRVRAYVRPGGDQRVRIELFGEDGRLLVRKLLVYGAEIESIYIDEILDFEIGGVAESARLQISTYDSYGRLVNLAAQDMVLLNIGEPDITPPGRLEEPVLIRQPRQNQFVQGGSLLVSGLIEPFNEQPILIELIDRQGKVVGYRQASVTIDPSGGYTPFTVEIPYQVSRATYVAVTVKVYSNTRISGIIYVTAREILISP